jgi:hypothetical protein
MRIIANKIVTKWEIEAERVPSDGWTRTELFTALGQELCKYNPLYFKEQRDNGDIEFRAEAFVFNRETLRNILKDMQDKYNIPEKDIQSIWLTMINSI